jgi:bifunctional DNA-binding transcriptional regulator/antitoxin component of YhaV-PrlF toxin-antitoxin module
MPWVPTTLSPGRSPRGGARVAHTFAAHVRARPELVWTTLTCGIVELCCLTVLQQYCIVVDVSNYHGYAAVQGRGTVALPAELRRKYRLDEPGAQLEVTERTDGVIELRPTLPIPIDEMWFWSEGHQAAEREAEDDLAAGRFRTFDDADSFLADLESLAADPDR